MDNIQIILVIVVIALTLLLIIVGVQVVLIILDMRRALKRLNSILDDAILGGGIVSPGKLSGLLDLLKKKKESNSGVRSDGFKEV